MLKRLRLGSSLWLRRGREMWNQFSMNHLAVLGVVLLVLYAILSVAHPVLMSTVWKKGVYDPQVGYDLDIFPHPSPPGPGHLLGTDTLGRDVLSRLLAATTPTFILALTAALATALFSTLSGAIIPSTSSLWPHDVMAACMSPLPIPSSMQVTPIWRT